LKVKNDKKRKDILDFSVGFGGGENNYEEEINPVFFYRLIVFMLTPTQIFI